MSEAGKSNEIKGILIVGPMGSGKDVLAEAFQRIIPGAVIAKLGKAIRGDVDRDYPFEENKRVLYQSYGQKMRALHGEDYWNERLSKQLWFEHAGNAFPIIADGRQTNEVHYWKNKGFLTIGILAPESIRKQRLGNRDGYTPAQENFTHDTELQSCYSATSLCDFHFVNDGELQFLGRVAALLCERYGIPYNEVK